jgi:hypothetical protein
MPILQSSASELLMVLASFVKAHVSVANGEL